MDHTKEEENKNKLVTVGVKEDGVTTLFSAKASQAASRTLLNQ